MCIDTRHLYTGLPTKDETDRRHGTLIKSSALNIVFLAFFIDWAKKETSL